MLYLSSFARVRAVDWGSQHLFDVRFSDPGLEEFTEWFPAAEVTENVFALENNEWTFYMSTYPVPMRSSNFTLDITFLDSVRHTVHDWATDWVNRQILNNGQYISTLEDSVKLVELVRVDAAHDIVRSAAYWVFPTGNLDWQGSAAPETVSNQLQFIIAGTASIEKAA